METQHRSPKVYSFKNMHMPYWMGIFLIPLTLLDFFFGLFGYQNFFFLLSKFLCLIIFLMAKFVLWKKEKTLYTLLYHGKWRWILLWGFICPLIGVLIFCFRGFDLVPKR